MYETQELSDVSVFSCDRMDRVCYVTSATYGIVCHLGICIFLMGEFLKNKHNE